MLYSSDDLALCKSESSVIKVAELMMKYGEKVALVGRILSGLGDTTAELGLWLERTKLAYRGESVH